jgi:hypothetical protein
MWVDEPTARSRSAQVRCGSQRRRAEQAVHAFISAADLPTHIPDRYDAPAAAVQVSHRGNSLSAELAREAPLMSLLLVVPCLASGRGG